LPLAGIFAPSGLKSSACFAFYRHFFAFFRPDPSLVPSADLSPLYDLSTIIRRNHLGLWQLWNSSGTGSRQLANKKSHLIKVAFGHD
jgi:hypothetical protein